MFQSTGQSSKDDPKPSGNIWRTAPKARTAAMMSRMCGNNKKQKVGDEKEVEEAVIWPAREEIEDQKMKNLALTHMDEETGEEDGIDAVTWWIHKQTQKDKDQFKARSQTELEASNNKVEVASVTQSTLEEELVTQEEKTGDTPTFHVNMARVRTVESKEEEPSVKRMKRSEGKFWDMQKGKKITIYESDDDDSTVIEILNEELSVAESLPSKSNVKYRDPRNDDISDNEGGLYDDVTEILASIPWRIEKCENGDEIQVPKFLYDENLRETPTELEESTDLSDSEETSPTNYPPRKVCTSYRNKAEGWHEVAEDEIRCFPDEELEAILKACEERDKKVGLKAPKKKKFCRLKGRPQTPIAVAKKPDAQIDDENDSWDNEENRNFVLQVIADMETEHEGKVPMIGDIYIDSDDDRKIPAKPSITNQAGMKTGENP